MIWARAVWGLILAGLLGYAFHRAWRRAARPASPPRPGRSDTV